MKLAWGYPAPLAPLCVGCVSLAMVYNDVTANDSLWRVSQIILNATWWVGGQVVDRFGEPSDRAVTATATVYADFMALVMGVLIVGLAIRPTMRYLLSVCARAFAWVPAIPTPPTKISAAFSPCPPTVSVPDYQEESDPGTASSSNSPGRVSGRRSCQAHCVWLSGKQASALLPAPAWGNV